jgi:nitroimidazol reductase NimA-like FMN-containing flavoprotein (pyridoxamine 5'-phosphate oxidase superfamily)
MGKQESEELLTRVGYGRLACARENQPYIVPFYFASKAGSLYGFATMGQKIEWMRVNPRVCVEVEEVRSERDWSSVLAHGRYEEFPDLPEFSQQRQEAQSFLEAKSYLWWQTGIAAGQPRYRFDRDIPIFFRIQIDHMTGRKASPDPS